MQASTVQESLLAHRSCLERKVVKIPLYHLRSQDATDQYPKDPLNALFKTLRTNEKSFFSSEFEGERRREEHRGAFKRPEVNGWSLQPCRWAGP